MRCRRICRELLWLARFGEFGPSSAPHLDHLARCEGCRDEVGFDRALVQQLRVALAARIEAASPSSHAWEVILERTRRPEPRVASRVWEWSTGLVARLRFATAMAGTGLALVLALNMEVVPVVTPAPQPTAETEAGQLRQVPRLPLERPSSAGSSTAVVEAGERVSRRTDPEALMTNVDARITSPVVPGDVSADEPADGEIRVVFRTLQSPEPTPADASAPVDEAAESWFRLKAEPGEPS